MNNEETIIMQPKTNNAANTTNVTKTEEVKNKKDNAGTAKRVAATTAAGVFGGAMGGAGSVVAAQMINAGEEEPVEEQTEEIVEEPQPQPSPKAEPETIEVVSEEGPDYTGAHNADPVVQEPEVIPVSETTDEAPEVQVLGVYERTTDDGTHQEMAILSNGEEVAAIVDVDGDGTADVLIADENGNNQIDEGEIYDISEHNVSMSGIEEQYIAQQQIETEQQDTFAYNADEQNDYNNDADVYYEA